MTTMMMMGYLGEMRSVCVPNPNIVEREDGGVDYSMGIYLLWTAARHRSRRVDNVDPLSRMLPTYMLVHVSSLLAARAAVRAFEPRRYAALVTQMALQTLHHGVTVPTLWTHVIFFLASSPSKRSVDVPDPRSLIFPRLLIRIGSVIPVYQAKRTIHWKQNKRDG